MYSSTSKVLTPAPIPLIIKFRLPILACCPLTLESHGSAISSASHTMRGQPQLKIAMGNDAKERPHSFSGGLSSADLRRLKQAGEEHVHVPARPWSSAAY
ncbi:hypothetical protein EDB19DRAFT_1884731 [Suillus lakei]|nr:hypothetical protein EDB19DRAFT_1884731 [Suillus lakei]